MKTVAVLAVLVILGGCTPTYEVTNPRTGQVAECGSDPLNWHFVLAHTAEACVAAYKHAGWVRGKTSEGPLLQFGEGPATTEAH
jgi:hypothetical protein